MIGKNNILALILFSIILLAAVSAVSASEFTGADELTDIGSLDGISADDNSLNSVNQGLSDGIKESSSEAEDPVNDMVGSSSAGEDSVNGIADSSSAGEDSIDDVVSNYEDNDKEITNYNDDVLDQSNGETLSEDPESTNIYNMTTLESLINSTASGSTLNLTNNFTYQSGDPILKINKPMTINGNGFTLDFKNQNRAFAVYSTNVTFRGINFINCGPTSQSYDGGAIYSSYTSSNSNVTAINCTFSNCCGNYGAGLYYVNAFFCKFYNCRARNYGGGMYGGSYSTCYWSGNSAYRGTNYYNSNQLSTSIILMNQTGGIFLEKEYPFEELEVSVNVTCGNYVIEGMPVRYYFEKNWDTIDSGYVASGSSVTINFDSAGYYYCDFSIYGFSSSIYSTLEVQINGNKTHFVANSMNITGGADEYYVATLLDANNNPLAGQNVTLSFSGNSNYYYKLITDENGQVNVSLKDFYAYQYNYYVYLHFYGNGSYENTNTNYNLKVNGNKTKMIASPKSVTGVYGEIEEIIATVTLLDDKDNALKGKIISSNGQNYTTDENGQATIYYKIPSAGSSSISYYFYGSPIYEGCSNYTSWSISKANVTFNAGNLAIHHYESANYTGQLVDLFDNPIVGANVTFYTSYNFTSRNVTTDENGYFSFTIPNNLNLGTFTIYLFFNGNSNYNKTSTLYRNLIVKKITPIINASDKRVVFNRDGEKLLVTFLNETGEPLEGFNLTVSFNDQNVTKTTDGNGQFTFDIPIGLDKGDYPIFIKYNGSDLYDNRSMTVNLNVDWMRTIVEISDIDLMYNETSTVIATLKDEFNNTLAGFDLSINFNGGSSNKITDGNGQISLDIPKLAVNNYPLTISFDGKDIYDKTTKSVNVNVNKILTAISVNDFNAAYNSGDAFIVYLKDYKGNALANKLITLKLDSYIFTNTTNSKGEAIFKINLPAKSWLANISCEEDDFYQACSEYSLFVVNKVDEDSVGAGGGSSSGGSSSGGSGSSGGSSSGGSSGSSSSNFNKLMTEISTPNLETVYKGGKYLTATLKDINGKPVSNAKITLRIAGKNYYKTTNKYGKVKFLINLAPKIYYGVLSFKGDSRYIKSSVQAQVLVSKAKTKLIAVKKKFKVKTKVKKYKVTLKDNKNRPIKKVLITLKVKGKTYKVKTNKKGIAIFKIKNLKKKGTFKAIIKFKGNKYYKKSRKVVKLIIK